MSYLLSIIIPCYNEENSILELLKLVTTTPRLNTQDVQFIVVNDGSTDKTKTLLDQSSYNNDSRFIFVHSPKNLGKGSALRQGIKVAEGEYTIIQDADLEYNPNDIVKLLNYAQEKNLPVVYGSRNLDPKVPKGTFMFYWGGKVVTWMFNLLFGQRITDEPTCYKLFKTDLLKSLPLQATGFEFCPEVTALIAKKKIHIPELPISYVPRNKEQGKKINWKDGVMALWTLLKIRFQTNNKIILAGIVFCFTIVVYLLTWGPIFMGYEKETADSALGLWQGGYQIFRAGIGTVLLYQPFIILGLLFKQHQTEILTLVPLVYSAGTVAVLFLILLKITKRTSLSLLFSLVVAFGSLLWPYSRIGMTYSLTFFLSLLMLSLLYWKEKTSSPIFVGAILAVATLSTSYGVLLCLPTLIFIVFELWQQKQIKLLFSPNFLIKLFGPLALSIITILFINWHLYGAYSLKQEFQIWSWWEGWFGIFFSFGKSIFIYNPLLILAIFYWPKFWREHKSIALFILASFATLLLITAPFSFWSDETLSVRKLVPIIPLLHLPLILIWENKPKFNSIKIVFLSLAIGLAFYVQIANSLYPYWRQLEFLRPYNLDNLTTMRYSPRVSHMALNSAFFGALIQSKLTGSSNNFFFLERSWMRCCTYPNQSDIVQQRININLSAYSRPDTFLFSPTPKQNKKLFLFFDSAAILLLGSFLIINYQGNKNSELYDSEK